MPTTTILRPGTFCWPELCTDNSAAAKKFYGKIFGWETTDEEMPDGGVYTSIKLQGHDLGAMYQMQPDRKQAGVKTHWNSYVSVNNADETARLAAKLGGKILQQPVDVMEGTRLATIQDPDGAVVSICQSKNFPAAPHLNEIGTLCWTELYTRDPEKEKAFYSKLFHWTAKPFKENPMVYTTFQFEDSEEMAGGMLQITEYMRDVPPHWLPYFRVEATDKKMEQVVQQGGKTIYGPVDIPTVGRLAILADPQGAAFAIIQINQRME